jgi:DNA-binding transcriptional ArsR family regulator
MVAQRVIATMVDSWTDSMTARERVETIATTVSESRTANWIAEQADVKWDTAKKHLDDLAESGVLLVTDDDEYVPDPTRAYFDHLRELILTNDREELRGELEAIADRIEGWKTAYGVDSPEDLEATLADDLPAEEISDRRQALRRWENGLRSRDTIQTALQLYDDIQSLSDGVPDNIRLEGAG